MHRQLAAMLLSGAAFFAPSAIHAAETPSTVGEVVVTARAAKLYRTTESEAAKMATEPLASSQMITVITEQLIRDQGARDAQDLYRNISGVSLFTYSGITARGFRQQDTFFYDGLRGDPYIGFSVPQLFNIQRVEFLKGPAGMLYGQTAPGGLFNYVTKKPSRTFSAEISAVGGTEDRYGGSAEITAPVGEYLGIRAGAFYEDRDLPRTNAGSKSLILDGGVSVELERAKLTVQALRVEMDLPGNRLRGVPTGVDGKFLTSRRWNANEASDYLDLRSTSLQSRLDWDVTDNLKVDLSVRRINALETQRYHDPFAPVDTNRDGVLDTVPRQFRDQSRDLASWSFGGNAVWSTSLSDTVDNRLLVGFDYSDSSLDLLGRFANGVATVRAGLPCPLALQNPVYRQCDSRNYTLSAPTLNVTEAKRTGVYALNELTIGKFVAVAGIRTDSYKDRADAARFKGNEETYRVGLVYRVRDDVSLFAQYATSFEPQAAASQDPRAGGPFEPTSGDILEGGLKTALMNGRIQSAIAVYKIRRTNLLQADPRGDVEGDGINNSMAFGEVTSEGVDVDFAADITPDWVLTLTYAYNDTRITKDNGRGGFANAIGTRFANAPKNKLGFWTRYQFPETGLAFAVGGDYVSRRRSLGVQTVKPYFVFDGSVTWTRDKWSVLLRVDNIFDETYAASGFTNTGGNFPGEPRSAFIETRYKF